MLRFGTVYKKAPCSFFKQMYITGTYKVWITQKVGDISQDFTWVLTPSKICETHTTLDEFLITEKTVTSK